MSHILVALWAVALALLTLLGLSFTHVLPFFLLDDRKHMLMAVEVAFPFLSVVYSFLLWRYAPRVQTLPFKIAATLPPTIFIWLLLF